jgi:hypothetical protein
MNRSRRPVKRLAAGNQLLRIGIGNLAGIGKLGGNIAQLIELRDVRFVAHGDKQEVAPFLRFAHAVNFHARTGLRELVVITVNVLRISQKVRRSNDVAENFVW